MTETKQTSTTKTDRRPDCVTEIRMGNSVLTVSGFFKQGATDTAADKMMKVRNRAGWSQRIRRNGPMKCSWTWRKTGRQNGRSVYHWRPVRKRKM